MLTQHLLFPEPCTALDCLVQAVGSLQWTSSGIGVLPESQSGEGVLLTYLGLLLGVQPLPKGLHLSSEVQEAWNAHLEQLLVVGLHRPLQPCLLSPPLHHEVQPRGPHLQEEEEVRSRPLW